MTRHARVQMLAHWDIGESSHNVSKGQAVTYLVKAPVSMLYAISIRTMLLVRELNPGVAMRPSRLVVPHAPWDILHMEFQYKGQR